jgi:hypothetical protein
MERIWAEEMVLSDGKTDQRRGSMRINGKRRKRHCSLDELILRRFCWCRVGRGLHEYSRLGGSVVMSVRILQRPGRNHTMIKPDYRGRAAGPLQDRSLILP